MFDHLLSRVRDRSPAEIARLVAKTIAHALAGLSPAARAARAADRAFDRRWGTDTSGGLSTRQLGFRGDALAHGRRYDPSSEAMLRQPIAALGLDPAGHDFIDYGAGKGRVLLLAMAMGFRSVTGVELSERLCTTARANIQCFADRHPALTPAQVIAGDAAAHPVQGGSILAYFYNPFDATVMIEVRRQLEAAARHAGGTVTVIYANPEHDALFRAAPGWTAGPTLPGIATFRFAGS